MSQRLAYIFCFITIALILSTGVYLELVEGIIPCPLCTLQRICFAICGIYFILGIFLYRFRLANMFINFGNMTFALAGILLAGRQLYIQFYPNPDNTECGVSIQYLLSVLPVKDVAQKIFSGGTECAQRGWVFLNLNIPEWSLLFFSAFFLIVLYYFIKDCKTKR